MKISTKTIVMVGMFTAVLSVLSILTIPMPTGVPVTLQTFAVALCGCVLGWKRGLSSVVIYLMLGTVGVPVFAGMTGGPSWLASFSGGFLWGFLFLSALCGVGMMQKNIILRLLFGLAGLAICHLLGVIQFSMVASSAIPVSFMTVSVPYIVKDVISVVGAFLVALPVRKALFAARILTEKNHGTMRTGEMGER